MNIITVYSSDKHLIFCVYLGDLNPVPRATEPCAEVACALMKLFFLDSCSIYSNFK